MTCLAADVALMQKLEEELKFETADSFPGQPEPEFLKAFKAQGTWAVSLAEFSSTCGRAGE